KRVDEKLKTWRYLSFNVALRRNRNVHIGCCYLSFVTRKRSALAITLTEDSDMAAAANIGDNKMSKNGYSTPAAMGMLYPFFDILNRFWRILRMVAMDSWRVSTMPIKSP